MSFYKKIIRPALFLFDPEKTHNFTIDFLGILDNFSQAKKILRSFFKYEEPSLAQNLFGLHFPNPLGLPAGFDKQAKAPFFWECLNFGFVELGSVTKAAQKGNPQPRLWRLIEEEALRVNLGLNSVGIKEFAKRFKNKKAKFPARIPFGVSIAKTTNISYDKSVEDYSASFKVVAPLFDFVSLNVSCPSVEEFTGLQKEKFLACLLQEIQKENQNFQKPLFVKIGPDNSPKELEKICHLALENKISALIATNLTKRREGRAHSIPQPGGISGKLLKEKSLETLRQIYKITEGKLTLIGLGGIFNTEDAYERIKNGASLVQVGTGLVYEGPSLVKKTCQGLVRLLKKDGYGHIEEAIGSGVR